MANAREMEDRPLIHVWYLGTMHAKHAIFTLTVMTPLGGLGRA